MNHKGVERNAEIRLQLEKLGYLYTIVVQLYRNIFVGKFYSFKKKGNIKCKIVTFKMLAIFYVYNSTCNFAKNITPSLEINIVQFVQLELFI